MNKLVKAIAVIVMITVSYSAFANFDDVEISAHQVRNNVFMLTGAGGNIGVLKGEDGILLVDDQFEPLAPKIEAALSGILPDGKNKVAYVVNTHYHGDHVGGNVYFSKSASILAHENVRKRMSVKSKGPGLPVITYQDGVKLHLNQEKVHVKHLSSGHTDGDSVVFFAKSNVWHLGDMLFESRFPYIDTKSGGSVSGYLNNLQQLVQMIDNEAKVIPGHGALTTVAGVQQSHDMIVATLKEVNAMKSQGLTLEQAIEKGLSEKWRDWSWSFITEKRWITTLYTN